MKQQACKLIRSQFHLIKWVKHLWLTLQLEALLSLALLAAWMRQKLNATRQDTQTWMLPLIQKLIGTRSVKLREDWVLVPRSWLSSRPNDTSIWILSSKNNLEGLEETPGTKPTNTLWLRVIRMPSLSTRPGTSSLSHGSAVLDSTQTANAKVLCTLDQLGDLTVVQRSKILTIWDNGEQSPKRLITGPCALLKILDQILGQIKKSSAGVSLNHSTSQVNALTRATTASVMAGLCLVLNNLLKTRVKMLNSRSQINNHSPWMTPIGLQALLAQHQASRMLILFLRERNNASAMRRNNSLIKTVSTRSKTTGELKSLNNKWKLSTRLPVKLWVKLKMKK